MNARQRRKLRRKTGFRWSDVMALATAAHWREQDRAKRRAVQRRTDPDTEEIGGFEHAGRMNDAFGITPEMPWYY